MSNDFFGSDWRIWGILVVWGARLCRIGGVGGLGEAGWAGASRIILRGLDGERRFW